MLIGHIAVGLAAKRFEPKLNLGMTIMASQVLDLIWPVLVIIGIEKVSVDHLATAVTPFNFEHYPYSHSLVMTTVYSLIGAAVAGQLLKSKRAGVVFGIVIFSHWILGINYLFNYR